MRKKERLLQKVQARKEVQEMSEEQQVKGN